METKYLEGDASPFGETSYRKNNIPFVLMSSAEVAAKIFSQLEIEDFRVLQVIEAAMSEHEFVPKRQIADYVGFNLDRETDFRLDRLSKMGLIYQSREGYVGFTLNYAGYDCLAMNFFVKANFLEAFGKPVGVGKEADVYTALTPEKKKVVVKFHRLGRVSFRQTQRKRGYMKEHASWLFQSRQAAEREFQALNLLLPEGVSVPRPIGHNRHVLVMDMIEGVELSKLKDVPNPKKVLKEVLLNLRNAYTKASIIHADLSEYNIVLKPSGRVLLIDWPQYVTTGHPNANELLLRDVKNITKYFERKHMVRANPKECSSYIMGASEALLIHAGSRAM